MKFAMPMVKDFVPKAVRPWLYVVMALCFQVSAARYLGALNEIIGATAQMREDVLMCLYCNLAGMALCTSCCILFLGICAVAFC